MCCSFWDTNCRMDQDSNPGLQLRAFHLHHPEESLLQTRHPATSGLTLVSSIRMEEKTYDGITTY